MFSQMCTLLPLVAYKLFRAVSTTTMYDMFLNLCTSCTNLYLKTMAFVIRKSHATMTTVNNYS